jgi:membrane protease YdiL (CAAX protease family)
MFVLKSQTLAEILKVISAWTATFVFVAMFHKIYPKGNLREYIKSQFSERIKISTVLCVILLQFFIFLGILLFTSTVGNMPIKAQLTTSWTTLLVIFGDNLIRGPLGEELGWRGFVLNELQKKFSPLKSAIIVGLAWGLWHAPLWFLASGYTGVQLVKYIICFLAYIIAGSIIMTAFYNLNHNLLIPIIIHQLMNYFLAIQNGDILSIITVTTSVYFVAAAILVLLNYKKCLYGKCVAKLEEVV